uniref:Bradykinin-potentiating peptide 12c n=1 Tax=Bothrops jararaca TaxID=8724 RepID=BPPCC_BOTJA|nr:RecName: Full=Bradykinin-potentiating peptide 12c; Short=BPP-12c; Contains: RecName: Full=Bradykinin-potentiating peptide 9a; Short=BPP-9a; Short=BPP-a; AltName: Full=Bradykinin-potentiating peptide V-6-I; Short=BPPV-6-I; AltName: Full=Teprotide; Contains: RecName: Full=Bradykinin-potentiating peptide 9a-F; Short=BPP-9a-F; AltName: Full=Bradykinin-potentiating peptide 5b; Short=BPP-5b [Bothrops jararaca]
QWAQWPRPQIPP